LTTATWCGVSHNVTAVSTQLTLTAVDFKYVIDPFAQAISTATALTGLWIYGRRVPLSNSSRLALVHVGGMVFVQVGLGIATLVNYVPISLASAHQAGSLTLLTFATWLSHTLRRAPKV